MTLTVYTAHVTYAGPGRLDITRKGSDRDGILFAPSWRLLNPMLAVRRNDPNWFRLWPQYVEDYTAEMRTSYRDHRAKWDELLASPEVTLVCYCTDPGHCHRTVLAGFLGKLGATVCGERQPDPRKV